MVAPVVRTPPQESGNPNSCFSHARDTASSRAPSGVAAHALAFWSSDEASQSAATAAGGAPADDEVEEPRARRADHRLHPVVEQLAHRRRSAVALLGKRTSEPHGRLVGALRAYELL